MNISLITNEHGHVVTMLLPCCQPAVGLLSSRSRQSVMITVNCNKDIRTCMYFYCTVLYCSVEERMDLPTNLCACVCDIQLLSIFDIN